MKETSLNDIDTTTRIEAFDNSDISTSRVNDGYCLTLVTLEFSDICCV